MFFKLVTVLILGSNKLLPEKFPGVLPRLAFLCEDAIAKEGSKYSSPTSKAVIWAWLHQYDSPAILHRVRAFSRAQDLTFEISRQQSLDILRMQNMESTRSYKKILVKVVPWFIVLCNRAEEGQEAAISIGIPELLDSVYSQGPSLWQLWWEFAAVFSLQGQISLRAVNIF
jgi:hypothetical protein